MEARKPSREFVLSKRVEEGIVGIHGVEFESKLVSSLSETRKATKRKLVKRKVMTSNEDEYEGKTLHSKSQINLSRNSETVDEDERLPISGKKGKVSVQETDCLEPDGCIVGGLAGFVTQDALVDKEVELIKDDTGDGGLIISQDDDMLLTHLSASKTPEAEEGDSLEVQERPFKSRAASSLPLVFGEKVNKTKVLLECEGDAVDLSGDMGAVGRFTVDLHDDELFLDLKGVVYKTSIVPSNTLFVVNVGQTEAKVESIMSDFVQLRADTNFNENETLVEGSLKGFAFDSDEDSARLAVNGCDKAATSEMVKFEEGDDDGKQTKKEPPAKALNNSKVPIQKVVGGKFKAGRGKASAKSGGKKLPAKT